MKDLLFVLATVLAGAAGADSAVKSSSSPGGQSALPTLSTNGILVLRRTACFGTCPIYQVEVDADGAVRYEGRAHVVKVGKASGHLAAADLEVLWKVIARMGAIRGVAERDCPRWVTCANSVIIAFKLSATTQGLRDYLGCRKMKDEQDDRDLKELRQLEDRVDAILQTEKWVGTPVERRAAAVKTEDVPPNRRPPWLDAARPPRAPTAEQR